MKLRPSLFTDQQGRVSQRAQQVVHDKAVVWRASRQGAQRRLPWLDRQQPSIWGLARTFAGRNDAKGQFILALMQAATASSVDVKTEVGAEFLQLLSKSHYVHHQVPCLT